MSRAFGRVLLGVAMATGVAFAASAVMADTIRVGGTGAANGLLQRLAAAYAAMEPGDRVEVVPGLGSGGGIMAVGEGALQLAVSSRLLKDEEAAKGLVGTPLLDTPYLFVTSHPQPQALRRADVVAIYAGGLGRWPDGREIRPILRPKSDAATPFLIANLEGMKDAMERLRARPDVPVAATDQDNVAMAERVADSFAGTTLIQAVTEAPRLRPVSLDGVAASVETMESRAYPLAMRLHVVTKTAPAPATQRFLVFLGSPEAERIMRESGGVRVPAKAAQTQ